MGNYNFKINGHDYAVTVNSITDGIAKVNVNGTDYEVEVPAAQAPAQTVKPVQSAAPEPKPQAPAPAAPAAGRNINSPLPGVIVEISVNPGQSVRRGQKVAVLEAMKMENEIQSPVDGTVTEFKVHKGDSILEGALIAVIG